MIPGPDLVGRVEALAGRTSLNRLNIPLASCTSLTRPLSAATLSLKGP
jgi:hypothetical protein